jgi:hypothetical protein
MIDVPGLIHHIEVQAIVDPQGVPIVDTVSILPGDTVDIANLIAFGEWSGGYDAIAMNR